MTLLGFHFDAVQPGFFPAVMRIRIRIQLPKMMRIRIRKTASKHNYLCTVI